MKRLHIFLLLLACLLLLCLCSCSAEGQACGQWLDVVSLTIWAIALLGFVILIACLIWAAKRRYAEATIR